MNPVWAKVAVVSASVVMIAIRAPHGSRSRKEKVARAAKGRRETIALTFAWFGFFTPFVWVASSLLEFADYELAPAAFVTGVFGLTGGLLLFHLSHAALGTNWSITLEVRENHRLVTNGVYRRVRHPMYTALFLYSIGQALALPNWIAGPSYLVSFGALFALRYAAEERMMAETFGKEWEAYRAKTKALIPGVW
jgi:protein-S-isoprenylcysteine O-methyltransferase Ste14